MAEFRTAEQRDRAKWAESYLSVARGSLYSGASPFPVHEYIKLKLLGKNNTMVELNAGAALIDQMVADTITEVQVQIESEGDAEQEVRDWLEEIDYETMLEEACRDYFSTGYGVQQPIRMKDDITASTVDPSTWYPDIPTFTHLQPTGGDIISVFEEDTKWYAFVEHHEVGKFEYRLYSIDNKDATDGKKVKLSAVPRFADLKEKGQTNLDYLAVFQRNRRKSSRKWFGQSVLAPVWSLLQEVTEIQTQIRQERIKHFKAKIALPANSLARIPQERKPEENHSKADFHKHLSGELQLYNANQEVFPVPPGSEMPAYIMRDLQTITIGSQEIDKLLGRIASIVGAPRSIFNLDEKGTVHVETEKKKDRRYMRHIAQAQKMMASLAFDIVWTYWTWKHGKEPASLTITLRDPFELSREEKVKLMREMNPEATLVSQKEAIKHIWQEMKPEERDTLLAEIQEEETARASTSSLNPFEVEL